MRRQVTIGGLVTLALLTGSVAAIAQPEPPAPGECAPTGATDEPGQEQADGEQPGLVPSARAGSAQDPEDEPSTEEPPTEEPSGEAPSGEAPSGEEPSGGEPSDEAPSDEEPSDEAPSAEEPSGEQRSGDASAGEETSGDEPAEEPSGEEASAGEPSGEEPAGEPTDEEPPSEEPSGEEPDDQPADDQPADDQPADDQPADDQSGDDQPADDQSGDDQSGDDQSGDDQSGDDQSGDDQPADDQSGDDQSSAEEPSADQPFDGEQSGGEPAAAAPADDTPAAGAGEDEASAAPVLDACGAPAATAASAFDWGSPTRVDEFDGEIDPASWQVYEGTGFDGQGTRTAEALNVQDGILSITGDAQGATGGMSWQPGQMYGRWEARVRAPASDESYNALLLLWPDDESGAGSEIDFMEMLDPTRQTTSAFVHHGENNEQVTGEVAVDGTQWHNWAVEWTPDSVTTYVDGVAWWRVDDPALLPKGPMHLCVQLDWFPTGAEGEVQESSMQVDWVRQYAVDPASSEPADVPPAEQPADATPAEQPDGTEQPENDGSNSASEGVAAPPARLIEGAPDAQRPGLVERAVPAAPRG